MTSGEKGYTASKEKLYRPHSILHSCLRYDKASKKGEVYVFIKSIFISTLSVILTGIFTNGSASESPPLLWDEGTSEYEKLSPCAACHLKNPLIRVTPEGYAATHAATKLVLGGGHIYDPETVQPEDYRSNGGLGLRESYHGNKNYHQNLGWYTVSAEVTSSFNSDMVCNIKKPDHQKYLARKDFWDIIWDDSAHVSVFEAKGLLEQIPTWLKPGGVYILGIPTMEGKPPAERNSVAEQIVDMYEKTGPDITPELINFVVPSLKHLGFSHVQVKESPILMALKAACGQTNLKTVIEEMNEEGGKQLLGEAAGFIQDLAIIDPVFREATIGMVYIVATR